MGPCRGSDSGSNPDPSAFYFYQRLDSIDIVYMYFAGRFYQIMVLFAGRRLANRQGYSVFRVLRCRGRACTPLRMALRACFARKP